MVSTVPYSLGDKLDVHSAQLASWPEGSWLEQRFIFFSSMVFSSIIVTLLYSWQAFTDFKGCACCAKRVQGYTAELSEALIFSIDAPQQHCLLTLYQHTSSYFATH